MRGFSSERLRRGEYAVVLTILLFVAGMAGVSMFGDLGVVADAMRAVDLHVVGALLLLSLVNYGLRALRWHLYSRRIGVNVSLFQSTAYYFAGFSLTTTPGKLGELLRLWMIERGHGYDYHRTVPLILGDRLADVNAMLLLIVVTVAVFPAYWWGAVIAFVGIALLTVAFAFPKPMVRAIGAVFALTNRSRATLFAKGRRALRLTARLFSWRLYVCALLLTTVGWMAECVAFYWLLTVLGVDASLGHAVFIFTFSMIAGAISMLPGGLGGVEAVMIGLLIGLGAEFEVAVAATSIIRFTTLWFAVGLGFGVLPFVLRLVRRSNQNHTANMSVSPS